MSQTFRCDVAIIGGGIAGLWTFQRLCREGFNPVLIESSALGHGQTLAAQGIVHGGAKYSMHGQISDHTQALAAMPEIWKSALAGTGEVDLSRAKVLAQSQYLWSGGGLASNLSAFFASKLIRSGVSAVEPQEWPSVFQSKSFRGKVYQLAELILDTRSVLECLCGEWRRNIYQETEVQIVSHGLEIKELRLNDGALNVRLVADRYLFTAGTGNEAFGTRLGLKEMQRRPLRMIMARGMPETFYGHCIGASPKPRVTVTTHFLDAGERVWYLGGEVAEKSASLSHAEGVTFAKQEMRELFPWIDWSGVTWASYPVDRAEPRQENALLPPGPTLRAAENFGLAWPTKMVFAPSLAAQCVEWIREAKVKPIIPELLPLKMAKPGKYPWESSVFEA